MRKHLSQYCRDFDLLPYLGAALIEFGYPGNSSCDGAGEGSEGRCTERLKIFVVLVSGVLCCLLQVLEQLDVF